LQDNLGKKKETNPTTLSLNQAIRTYGRHAPMWLILQVVTLLFFFAAQSSRQISDFW
jgi:hypothetical protein